MSPFFKNSSHPAVRLQLAIAILGGSGLFARLIHLNPFEITFWRCLLALPVLLAFSFYKKISLKPLHKKDLFLIFLAGFLMCAHWTAIVKSIQKGGVTPAIITLYTYPTITLLIEALSEKKWPSFRAFFLSVAGLGGAFLAAPSGIETEGAMDACIFWALFASTAISCRNVLSKRLIKDYGGICLMIWSLGVGVLLFSFVPFTQSTPLSIAWQDWTYLAFLGVVFTGLGHSMLLSSFKYYRASAVGQASTMQLLYSPVYAWMLFKEPLGWNTLLGGGIVATVSVMASLKKGTA